jgi:putative ABC transport system permease protein
MRTNSFKSFIKYLAKNKLYTFVTLSGFAISLMFVLLLSVYIRQELSVDQFHANKNRIFHLSRDNGATFAPPIGDFIKNQFPEVEAYTRIYDNGGNAKFEGKQQIRFEYMLADSSFFSMFSFKLKEGDPKHVLASKNSAVLFESFARKVFGDENPMGKTFTVNQTNFIVSGIAEDMPDNTQFQKRDAILNFPVLADLWGWKELLTSNGNSSFGLYFMAKEGTNLPSKAPQILAQFKKDYWLYTGGFAKTLQFEPLTEVYFSKEPGRAIRQNSLTTVFIFGGIALLILIIAIINYINLTVAQAGFRSKETAIKKLMGSSKSALLWQHITESVALSLLASLVALGLAFLTEPFFNTQMNCHLNLRHQFSLSFISTMLGVIAATGFISGIIPAIVANKFNPIEVVKGNFTRKTKSNYSKVLIAFQYNVAIVLLICTWTIARQSNFMQNYNTGFEKENLFWMDNTLGANQKAAFRDLLKTIPGVAEVSFCRGTPLDGGNNQSFNYKGKPVSFQEFTVDSTYFNLLGVKVANTTTAFSKDGVWLNRKAVQVLELGENPVSFRFHDQDLPILGITDNFNFRSLYQEIGPLLVRQLPANNEAWSILVKLNGTNLVSTVDQIKKAQAKFTGGIPMDSGFIDVSINQWYEKEVKRSKLIGAFTLLSIIISSMGIFAMSLYYIQQKIKEIGIRKVNGATISEVITMLNRDFVKWVAIAFVIATPIAYFVMNKWLENFAYKTSLSWWIFAMAGLLALGIALLTVSWQSWKAAKRNPVEALRYE